MNEPVTIVYDGECPFCSAYVKMLRLKRAVGNVEIVDARSSHPAVATLERQGFDLDEGMAVVIGDRVHHGAEAVHWLSTMSTPSATLNGLMARLLRHQRMARIAYPFLRSGRNAALALMGRKRIARRKN
ncbi:thiol-disulfide oxidoreductase DCC family protein [Croceicoccus bisphenolivorans]|uniref:thiol-disulfide oxidoreductase DCC family protein n=1 Tax=Croceicoccus bisphenolivorans TaxID=1783232 RepID=UPI0008295441|nr:DUF393 domain-containing protein [Croceicoccus bisphenolivorans]